VLRRTDPNRAVGQMFQFGDLDVDIAALKIKRREKEVEITRREAAIIQYFAANPNRVISREELYKEVWNETMTELGTRTMDMHIAKLRGKIEKDSADPRIIKTVRGAGYKYETNG
jgi:DNA-binding response OmpR family regulator